MVFESDGMVHFIIFPGYLYIEFQNMTSSFLSKLT
jgi:hypothetical protein